MIQMAYINHLLPYMYDVYIVPWSINKLWDNNMTFTWPKLELENMRFFVKLNGKRSRLRKRMNDLSQGSASASVQHLPQWPTSVSRINELCSQEHQQRQPYDSPSPTQSTNWRKILLRPRQACSTHGILKLGGNRPWFWTVSTWNFFVYLSVNWNFSKIPRLRSCPSKLKHSYPLDMGRTGKQGSIVPQ